MTEVVFGLDGQQWTAVAAIAQGLAALGAIALLVVTWMSQRSSRDALASARSLATATEALAVISKRQANLSVLPVIEVMYEPHNQRLRLQNKGNGPLLGPTANLDQQDLRLISTDTLGAAQHRPAALAVGEVMFALLETRMASTNNLSFRGLTLSGEEFRALIDYSELTTHGSTVAMPPLTAGT